MSLLQTSELITDFGICGSGVIWTLTDAGMLTISGEGEITSAPWKSNGCAIRNAVIRDGVTSVADGAFEDCSQLGTISIPDSVSYIGTNAFSGTSSLRDVYYTGTISIDSGYAVIHSGKTSAVSDFSYSEGKSSGTVYVPKNIVAAALISDYEESGKFAYVKIVELRSGETNVVTVTLKEKQYLLVSVPDRNCKPICENIFYKDYTINRCWRKQNEENT